VKGPRKILESPNDRRPELEAVFLEASEKRVQ